MEWHKLLCFSSIISPSAFSLWKGDYFDSGQSRQKASQKTGTRHSAKFLAEFQVVLGDEVQSQFKHTQQSFGLDYNPLLPTGTVIQRFWWKGHRLNATQPLLVHFPCPWSCCRTSQCFPVWWPDWPERPAQISEREPLHLSSWSRHKD